MGRLVIVGGVVAVGLAASCAYRGADPGEPTDGDPSTTPDSPPGTPDGPPADAVVLGPWGPAIKIPSLSSGNGDDDPSLTADLREIYFGSDRNGGGTGEDVWRSTRPNVDAEWDPPMRVAELSSPYTDSNIKVAADGLTLMLASNRDTTDSEVYVSTRLTRDAPWSTPMRIDELCSSAGDFCPYVRPNLVRLVYCSSRTGDEDLYQTQRASPTDVWDAPMRIPNVNSTANECDPMEPDDRWLYFSSQRAGGQGDSDLYVAERVGDDYTAPQPIVELNTASRDRDPWVTADGRLMVFSSNRDGTDDLFYAVR